MTVDGQCIYVNFFMQSAAVPNSGSMEKEGLVRCLAKLEGQGITVRSLTTGNVNVKTRHCPY